MLVAGEKSSLLISIVFRKRVEEETISFPGFENRFVFFPVSQIFSVSSKPRVIIPASPQLLWSEGQARACCPEDPRAGKQEEGLLPLALRLG